MLKQLQSDLKKAGDAKQKEILQRFFKTGPGQYGEGDVFLGIKVPVQRQIAKKYFGEISLKDIDELLNSKIHEERLVGLFVLMDKFAKEEDQKEIFNFYLGNAKQVNNWDLVDLSAPNIMGNYLFHNPREKKVLYKLAQSKNLWEKRISILSTFYFIRKDSFDDTLAIAEILLGDSHDLIHKAVGWMLREVGKRSLEVEENFLKKHYKNMPRTMLRYAIERFEETKRLRYLKDEI